MRTLFTRCLLVLALALAGGSLPGTSNTAQADEPGARPMGGPLSSLDRRIVRRWRFRPYMVRPYLDGGGYYNGGYESPSLYYRRIAPGVYYYF
jgi:hypothetical protein